MARARDSSRLRGLRRLERREGNGAYQHDAIHHWPGRRMDVTGSSNEPIADAWQEYVFGYSYALLARERHIPIGFVSFDLGFGSLDNALAHAPTTPIDGSDLHAFEKKLQVTAKAAKAKVTFRELRPGPVPLEASFTTNKPLALVRENIQSFRAPKGLFGFLLEILRPSGEIAFAQASSPGGGMTSADPPLLGCFLPYMDFTGPAQTPIPPCPT